MIISIGFSPTMQQSWMKGLPLSSLAPRFKAGVPACAEAALNELPGAGGAWA